MEVTHGGKADRKARCNYCWELDKWKMHSIIVPSSSEKAGCLPELCILASFVSFIAGVLLVEFAIRTVRSLANNSRKTNPRMMPRRCLTANFSLLDSHFRLRETERNQFYLNDGLYADCVRDCNVYTLFIAIYVFK